MKTLESMCKDRAADHMLLELPDGKWGVLSGNTTRFLLQTKNINEGDYSCLSYSGTLPGAAKYIFKVIQFHHSIGNGSIPRYTWPTSGLLADEYRRLSTYLLDGIEVKGTIEQQLKSIARELEALQKPELSKHCSKIANAIGKLKEQPKLESKLDLALKDHANND